jgi:predicted RNA-binding protein with PUA-like domain
VGDSGVTITSVAFEYIGASEVWATVMSFSLARQFWLVKFDPYNDDNDPEGFFERRSTTRWRTRRLPKDCKNGDGVFFWEMSPTLGVVGLGEFQWQLDQVDAEDRWLFEVKHLSARLKHPVLIDELRQLSSMLNAAFLKSGPQGTVYRVDPAQAADIQKRVVSKNGAFRRLWPELTRRPSRALAKHR